MQRLRGVSYTYTANGKHDIGMIAEEVGRVVPEVVGYEDSGKDARGIDYARLSALLVGAVRQHTEIQQEGSEIRGCLYIAFYVCAHHQRGLSSSRAKQAFPSNSSPSIGQQQYTVAGRSAIRPKGCAPASPMMMHTRPGPLLGGSDEAGPHWVEMNVLHFLVVSLNASQRAFK